MRRDSMQQELTESFSDFHFFAISKVREGMLNDCDVVFIDYVVLIIAWGKNDRGTYGNAGANKGWQKDVFIVHKSRVDLTECRIRQDLPLSVCLFRLRATIGVVILKETCHLTFGLWIVCRDEFRHLSFCLSLLRYSFPTASIHGGVLRRSRRHWRSGIRNSSSSSPGQTFSGSLLCQLEFQSLLGWGCRRCFHWELDGLMVCE